MRICEVKKSHTKDANFKQVIVCVISGALFIVVDLAPMSSETRSAVADKRIERVATSSSVGAGIVVPAFVHHFLAPITCIANGASAPKAVDEISANASITAGVGAAFVDVCLAMSSRKS